MSLPNPWTALSNSVKLIIDSCPQCCAIVCWFGYIHMNIVLAVFTHCFDPIVVLENVYCCRRRCGWFLCLLRSITANQRKSIGTFVKYLFVKKRSNKKKIFSHFYHKWITKQSTENQVNQECQFKTKKQNRCFPYLIFTDARIEYKLKINSLTQ